MPKVPRRGEGVSFRMLATSRTGEDVRGGNELRQAESAAAWGC